MGQRFLPANIAMDFAQGLCARVENKEKSNRSFNFTYGGGSIFPLVRGRSLGGLGYNFGATAGGGGANGAWPGYRGGEWGASRFQNLCQAKTAILGELCGQRCATVIQAGV